MAESLFIAVHGSGSLGAHGMVGGAGRKRATYATFAELALPSLEDSFCAGPHTLCWTASLRCQCHQTALAIAQSCSPGPAHYSDMNKFTESDHDSSAQGRFGDSEGNERPPRFFST